MKEQGRDGSPEKSWVGTEGSRECYGQLPGGQGCITLLAVEPARLW